MCQIPCDVSNARDMAITSVNAQTKKHVLNVLMRVQTMTVLHVQIPSIASTARLHTLPFLKTVLHEEKKKKSYQLSTIIMLAFQMLENYLNSVRKRLLVLAMQVLLVRHLKRMTPILVRFSLKSSFKNFLM